MAKKGKQTTANSPPNKQKEAPRSIALLAGGMRTVGNLLDAQFAVAVDVGSGTLSYQQGNTMIKACDAPYKWTALKLKFPKAFHSGTELTKLLA